MKKIKGFLILLILLIFSIITFAQVDYNQAKGVAPNTRFSSGAGNENINIMNGNLMFSFTDASLPGRNGLYPSLTRMYNSKIWHNCLIRENGKLKKTLTIKEIGEFGVGWSLGVPTLRIRSKNKSDTMVQDIDDHVRFPISDEFVLIETDGSEHTFAEPNENLLFPGYLTSYTTDNSYYLVKFKAEDFDIETPNSYSDDVYLPKSPTSRIEIFTKSGVLYEAYPNYRDRTALKDEIEVINGEDISDDVIDSWIQAIQDSYPLRKYRWLDYKVLKIQDTNGNYFKYNYESKANTITVSIEIDREKIFTPPHIQVTSSPDEIMQYIFQIINSANIRELDQEPSGENYDITYNEDSVYFEFPLVETLKYDTISSIEDSNGYKIEINWDEWTYKGGLDVNYIKNIRYKNSNNEVLTVKYEYINRTINAGSVYTVSTESRNVKLLKRVRFLKSGIDIINPFIYDYDGNGHLNKIIYPVNNSNNLDSNGIKMNPDDATKGIVEYSYHRYNYYAPYDIEKLKDIIHEEGNSSPKVFTHCTYGVLTRKEDRDQDKETKYYRVCNPENASFPALVRIEFPDNSNEVHYYINEGIWKRYQNRSIFINSPYSGYERCTEFYEGEVSFNLFNLQVEGCLVQKIEFEWITQQFPEDWFINNPPTVYNTRLMSKTIHKYDKINQALVYSTGFKNIVFDNYGNVKLLRNKRKLRDNDGNLYIDDDIKLIKTFLHETDIEYRKRNILNKTKIIKKEDINGKLLSKKEFIFDDYSINPGNIPENYSLNDSDLISIYYDPSKKDELIRGNLTKSITYYGEYDETGNITWDPGKDVIRNFGYDIFGNQIINVDAMGNITTKTFDPSYKYSMPTQITNPKNQTSLYNYYPNTYLLKDTTNINGNVSLKEYDSLDRTVKVTYPQPDGGHTLYEYNDLVYPIYTIEKNLIDDSSGEKYAESIYYFDCWSRYIYGAMKEKQESDGRTRWVVNGINYDNMSRQWKIFEPSFQWLDTPTQCVDPRNQAGQSYIEYEYDGLGRQNKIYIPDAEEGMNNRKYIEYEYKDGHNYIIKYDVNRRSKRNFYNTQDLLERVVEVDENGIELSKTFYKYDLIGNHIETRTSKDDETWMKSHYFYSTLDRKIKEIEPDSGIKEFQFDKNGNLIWSRDGVSNEKTFQYDELNRLVQKIYPDGSYIENIYDNAGNNGIGMLYSKSKYDKDNNILNSHLINGYNQLGRIKSKNEEIYHDIITGPVNIAHNYNYNKGGQLLDNSIFVNGSEIQKSIYEYDYMGRAVKLNEELMGDSLSNQSIVELQDFNPMGQTLKTRFEQNDIIVNYRYNPFRYWNEYFELVKSDTIIYKNEYKYDDVGNRVELIDEHNISTQYEYDSLDRLITVNGKYYGKGSSYSYDNTGNRLTYDSKYNNIPYEYDIKSNMMTKMNLNYKAGKNEYVLFFYDGNGNPKQRDYFRNGDEVYKQELYEYDYDNMMVKYTRHLPKIIDNKIVMKIESQLQMFYDVNGMRVIKECYPNTNDSTIYIYEGTNVVMEMKLEDIPKPKHLYTNIGDKKYSRVDFDAAGSLIPGSRKFLYSDTIGSVVLVLDNVGNVLEHNKYEPFGDIIWTKTIEGLDNNYKFTGKERDRESGLDYFEARFLDTKMGRFMKPDPLKGNLNNPQSLNRWVYCMNNPIKYKDPHGLEVKFDAISQSTKDTEKGEEKKAEDKTEKTLEELKKQLNQFKSELLEREKGINEIKEEKTIFSDDPDDILAESRSDLSKNTIEGTREGIITRDDGTKVFTSEREKNDTIKEAQGVQEIGAYIVVGATFLGAIGYKLKRPTIIGVSWSVGFLGSGLVALGMSQERLAKDIPVKPPFEVDLE